MLWLELRELWFGDAQGWPLLISNSWMYSSSIGSQCLSLANILHCPLVTSSGLHSNLEKRLTCFPPLFPGSPGPMGMTEFMKHLSNGCFLQCGFKSQWSVANWQDISQSDHSAPWRKIIVIVLKWVVKGWALLEYPDKCHCVERGQLVSLLLALAKDYNMGEEKRLLQSNATCM